MPLYRMHHILCLNIFGSFRKFIYLDIETLSVAYLVSRMYIISILLNAYFNIDIAKRVYTMEHKHAVKRAKPVIGLLRDSMYNYTLMWWVSVFCWGIFRIRIFGPLVSLIWTSWAISFYAYDIVWTLRGWDFGKRLLVFQRHWIFMLGFGFPSALVTFVMPQFLGYSIYALTFSCFYYSRANFQTNTAYTSKHYLPEKFTSFPICRIRKSVTSVSHIYVQVHH